MAASRDKYALYQLAVQSPDYDVRLLRDLYRRSRGNTAYRLREDFCGTAATLSEWVKLGKRYSGEGIDNDPHPLDWGRVHNVEPLGTAAARAELRLADARTASITPPDIRCAFNFSYWVFCQRATLQAYFRAAYTDLAPHGIFVVDVFGGYDSLSEHEYTVEVGDFVSVWHQTNIRPVDNQADLALHFRFADGSEMHNAYRYHWRIWSLPEIIELLQLAGFARTKVYWQTEGQAGDCYVATQTGWNDSSWIACVVALK